MKIIVLLYALFFFVQQPAAQGCIAIRSNGGSCAAGMDALLEEKKTYGWVVAVNNRYFRSFRHFIGKEEQKQRVALGTEVVNHSFSSEIGLTRHLDRRWSLSLFVPLTANERSSLYEHDGKKRNTTRSFGLGDVRMAAYYWLTDPVQHNRTKFQLGLGLKLPMGDFRYLDYFQRNDSTKVLGPVDQSIQLGDGGTGITTEVNVYHLFTKKTGLYANGYYLLNPREQNGVSTARGGVPSAASLSYGSDVMSVPDQFMFRLGGQLSVEEFTFSAGMRIEGIPAKDIVGGSNGFRRPGYVLSAESAVVYSFHKTQLYISIPFAVQRNRTQSIPDEIRTQKTGSYFKGDAAFADYSLNFGAVFSL